MKEFIEESKILSAPDIGCFAKSLVDNALPLLRTSSAHSSLEGTVTEMAVHAAIIFLCGQNRVLAPLRNLAFEPANMANAFLPTMPEDLLVQARKWTGLEGVHWYNCPNGHPCSVGECGKPMEQSFWISSRGHFLYQFKQGPGVVGQPEGSINEDRTQTGHVLGDPQLSGEAVACDRGLSPVVFILTRLLTHLAMLVGATQNPQALIRIIKPQVQDPQGFLQQHIQRNLEHLNKMLGRSADETTRVVHLILRCLLQERHPTFGQGVLNFNAELSTKAFRNNWEKHLEALILPELEVSWDGEIKLPKDYCSSDLDLDVEFEVILPRRRGLGLCATALVSYLISLHNQMVNTVQKFSTENSSYSVDTSEVTDLHVIHYDVERDLIPLIVSNCQYQVQQGGETSQEFDLEKIQRQISSRFLQGKPRLTLQGIPTLVYRHDWNYEHLFTTIKNKTAQVLLTALVLLREALSTPDSSSLILCPL
ncbi:E3 ubiquitin-protein ligase RNF213-like, partial [Microtus ochrogaster]|uniref:E3 ubiquitin-protein ligase RNF213-like n=1 Tax=Microtus ochrogaster TaxID=79684 RepID=A0ABM1TX41_MICOH